MHNHITLLVHGGRVKQKVFKRYDYRNKNIIRVRENTLDDHAIVARECNLTLRREWLLPKWATSSLDNQKELQEHLSECIKLVDFELDLIHKTMSQRGLKPWSGAFMKKNE